MYFLSWLQSIPPHSPLGNSRGRSCCELRHLGRRIMEDVSPTRQTTVRHITPCLKSPGYIGLLERPVYLRLKTYVRLSNIIGLELYRANVITSSIMIHEKIILRPSNCRVPCVCGGVTFSYVRRSKSVALLWVWSRLLAIQRLATWNAQSTDVKSGLVVALQG